MKKHIQDLTKSRETNHGNKKVNGNFTSFEMSKNKYCKEPKSSLVNYYRKYK